jgi:hypothetical protein
MWDWDTYFASLLAAESDEMLGYSNVLTVTRGRTIRGQVPNAECAQWTNDDRTEPYVGAMVVREHYKKFGEVRLLELLYDDLRTWNDWALAKRSLQVRQTPGWPRSWANSSLLLLYSHRNAWANLRLSGQPNTLARFSLEG